MNYYERIQLSIDHIEENLKMPFTIEETAKKAFLSLPHYYRLFHAITGHSVKDYIRKRRLWESGKELISGSRKIIDIAMDYQFISQESFTRAFKTFHGMTPGKYRKSKELNGNFKRLDIMKEYFIPESEEFHETIKILKCLKPMRVAYYRAVGKNPELNAWGELFRWAEEKELFKRHDGWRLFGFNNPCPSKDNPVYGYEAWITVPDDMEEDGNVKIKYFSGGLYAVTGTSLKEIETAWKNLVTWQKISKYKMGSHQCLEEHLSKPEEIMNSNIEFNLYLPLAE